MRKSRLIVLVGITLAAGAVVLAQQQRPAHSPAPQADDTEETAQKSTLLTEEIWDRALKSMAAPLASKLFKADHQLNGEMLVLTLNGGDSVFADSIKKQGKNISGIFSEELGSRIHVEVVTVKKKTVRKKDLKNEVM